jgi:putative ABC transport system ATP-binding protein
MKNLIETKNLTKIYKEAGHELVALKNINLKVKKGEFVSLMGPSGSGKTTLLNILGCLDRPTSGSYKLDGKEIINKNERELARIRNKKIGFIFQTFNLLPRYNVISNIKLPTIYSKNHKVTRKEILELLNKVGLKERANHKPNQLSGGEQQRVAIARALINNPEIILADEPTGNLDKKSEDEIMQILKNLNQEGVTLILVTHDLKIAQQAQRIIKLEDGEII